MASPNVALAFARPCAQDPRVRDAIALGIMQRPLFTAASEVVHVDRVRDSAPSRPGSMIVSHRTSRRTPSRSGPIVCRAPRVAQPKPLEAAQALEGSEGAASRRMHLRRSGVACVSLLAHGLLARPTHAAAESVLGSQTELNSSRVVLVSGATGRTGTRVVEALRSNAARVSVVAGVRSEASAQRKLPIGTETIVSDLATEPAVADLTQAMHALRD